MRVLVSGSGGSFAQALLPVLCAERDVERVTALEAPLRGFEHAKLDARRGGSGELPAAGILREHDALVHVPPIDVCARSGTPPDVLARAAHRLFLTARAEGVRRFVHISTAAVYGSAVHAAEHAPLKPWPDFAYAQYQALLEQLLAFDVPECVRLRPHLIAGPHASRALKLVLRQPFYPRGSAASALFQCVHEADLAQAVVLSLQGDARGPYNLATEDSFSLRDALRSRHAFAIGLPDAAAARVFGAGARILRAGLDAAWLERASHTLLVNCRRALSELGWRRSYTALEALSTV